MSDMIKLLFVNNTEIKFVLRTENLKTRNSKLKKVFAQKSENLKLTINKIQNW